MAQQSAEDLQMANIPVLLNGHIIRLPPEITLAEAQALVDLTPEIFKQRLAAFIKAHRTKPNNNTLNFNELVQGKCKEKVAQAPAPVLPADLAELAALWPSLPDAVKAGFIATAKAIGGKA